MIVIACDLRTTHEEELHNCRSALANQLLAQASLAGLRTSYQAVDVNPEGCSVIHDDVQKSPQFHVVDLRRVLRPKLDIDAPAEYADTLVVVYDQDTFADRDQLVKWQRLQRRLSLFAKNTLAAVGFSETYSPVNACVQAALAKCQGHRTTEAQLC